MLLLPGICAQSSARRIRAIDGTERYTNCSTAAASGSHTWGDISLNPEGRPFDSDENMSIGPETMSDGTDRCIHRLSAHHTEAERYPFSSTDFEMALHSDHQLQVILNAFCQPTNLVLTRRDVLIFVASWILGRGPQIPHMLRLQMA
jgi:hypothetical protein